MGKEQKERIEEAMRQLTGTLHEQLRDTGFVTDEQWDAEIAPKLSALGMAIDDVNVTARTYRVGQSVNWPMNRLRVDENKDHQFVARRTPMGNKELHDCVSPDHGPVAVCDVCGKDYHELFDDHVKCPLGK